MPKTRQNGGEIRETKRHNRPKGKNIARKEVTHMELRQYRLQFQEAKLHEHKSWVDNDLDDLMNMRKHPARNFVKERWALTLKRDKYGTFQKCKARWVLKGLQDKTYGPRN